MSNMSYCRFENTSNDMQDCWNALQEAEAEGNLQEWFKDLGEYEQRGVMRLLQLSKMFAELDLENELEG